MESVAQPPARKLSRPERQIVDLARDCRDIAIVGQRLGDLGRSVDDLPEMLTDLARQLDKHFLGAPRKLGALAG